MAMKRFLVALVAFMLLITMLTACDGDGEESKAMVSTVSSDVSGNSDLWESGITGLDFEGREFIILSSYTHGIDPSSNTFFGGNGEYEENVVNDAALLRNSVVEDKLGIKIVERIHEDTNAGGTGSLQTYVDNSVNTAIVDYHMIQGSLYNCGNFVKNGLVEDMTTMKYLDFSKPWWSQTFIDDTGYGSSVYYAVGDISYGHINCIYFVIFNKDLQAEYELDDFYELVRQEQWTYDVMFENSKKVLDDLTANGTYEFGDLVGSCGQTSVMHAVYYASNGRITSKDGEGKPTLTFDTADSIIKVEKLANFFMEPSNYLVLSDAESIESISQSHTLFFCYHTGGIKGIGEVQSDIGFLPHPKFDEDQDDYYALISPWGGQAVCVPFAYGDEDLDYISAVMEEMAVQGKNYLTSAFAETMCMYQKSRDEESIEMLRIIFDRAGCDLGLIYRFGGYQADLQLFVENQSQAIASTIDSHRESAIKQIQEYIDTIESLEK